MDNFAAQGEALLSVSLQLSTLQSLVTFSSPVPHPPRFLMVCFRVSASHRSFSFTPRRPLEAGRSAWTVYCFFPFCFFAERQLRSRPHYENVIILKACSQYHAKNKHQKPNNPFMATFQKVCCKTCSCENRISPLWCHKMPRNISQPGVRSNHLRRPCGRLLSDPVPKGQTRLDSLDFIVPQ